MFSTLYIMSGLACVLVIVSLLWRFSSIRVSIPCPSWLSWFVELDNPFLRNNRASEIIHHLDLLSGMKVLDFGCGPGRVTIPLAKQIGPSGKVTAFDIQSGMLGRVRAKASDQKIANIEFVLGAAGEGKLGHNEYDRALLVTVLGEIPDQKTALKEIFDCLKPGGLLSITEVIADPHFQSRRNVTEIARSVGFTEKGFFGNQISYSINFEKH